MTPLCWYCGASPLSAAPHAPRCIYNPPLAPEKVAKGVRRFPR